jgi:hypothetical protein
MNCRWNIRKWYYFCLSLAIFRTVMKISRYSRSPNLGRNMVSSAQKIGVPYSAIRNAVALKTGTHYPHVTFHVLFSTTSLFLPMSWLSHAAPYNLVTWCRIKRTVGALFPPFLETTGNNVEEHSTRTSRLTKCVPTGT